MLNDFSTMKIRIWLFLTSKYDLRHTWYTHSGFIFPGSPSMFVFDIVLDQ